MKLADAVLVWLDVVPLNMITSEAAVSVIKMYRKKQIDVSHAIKQLWEHCEDQITAWVYFNFQVQYVETVLPDDEN